MDHLDAPGNSPRLTTSERRICKSAYGYEPALGTVREKLNIIIAEQGGSVGPVRLTKAERDEYAAWLAKQ